MARQRSTRTGNEQRQVEEHLSQIRDSAENMVGVVGDQSTTTTRSGEDTRKRGWYWHWNHIVTQYAPLIGLKGIGLLNSYTVWTDRREESPHRGYAFPSQQREADFYGEDRAELITINKILVALDLIEIRKEMVYRTDELGRRWKVPHNFYRVKDKGDGVSLTTDDVQRVIELAARDRAVYRYLRKIFSPKFAPIDADNVWHQILTEIRQTETWQKLAERAGKEEARTSARSKAGHASRRANDTSTAFSLSENGDNATPGDQHNDSTNDSNDVANQTQPEPLQTSVAPFNKGSATNVEQTNNGFDQFSESSVAHTNQAGPTIVAPTNTTYNQEKTTTTTGEPSATNQREIPGETRESRTNPADSIPTPALTKPPSESNQADFGSGAAPDAARDMQRAQRVFEEANERSATAAERRLLRNIAEQFNEVALLHGANGWVWLADAIDEAVASGSRFVAPKRAREIMQRWSRDGRDDQYVASEPVRDRPAHVSAQTSPARSQHASTELRDAPPEPFEIPECGCSSSQVWNQAKELLRTRPEFSRVGAETWLRDTHLIGRTTSGSFVVGVGNPLAQQRLSGRYLRAIEEVLHQVTALPVSVTVADYRRWEDQLESA